MVLGTWSPVSPWKGLECASLKKGTLQGRSPAAPGGESGPTASPTHPGRAQCSASPGGVRARGGAATSKEAHSEGSGRVGRRKESPDCWAAGRGLLRAVCPVSASRLGPACSPLQFASSHSASLLPPPPTSSSKNLPAKTHRNLIPHGDRGQPAEARGRTNGHAPHLPCSATRGGRRKGREAEQPIPFLVPRITSALHKAARRLQLQNQLLGICSNCRLPSWL